MASLNKVLLIGRLGRDVEVKYLPNGNAVANFSIATEETWKDKAGEKQSVTEWHKIVIYGKLAEIAGKYLGKGSLVYLEGRITSRKWTNKENVEQLCIEIVCDEMKMMGDNKSKASSGSYSQSGLSKGKEQNESSSKFDSDDDIPF